MLFTANLRKEVFFVWRRDTPRRVSTPHTTNINSYTSHMFITILTDCDDQNDRARLATKISTLFEITPHISGVNNFDGLQAGGCLLDTLDASEGKQGIVLVNNAPRHKGQTKNRNGAKFGYFYHKNTLVVSTIDGYTLSFIKKLQLADTLHVLEEEVVLNFAVRQKLLEGARAQSILNTQFRSLNYQPLVAKWIYQGIKLPTSEFKVSNLDDLPASIWFVDGFGNCKTTLLPHELKKLRTGALRDVPYHSYLRDVPKGEVSITTGSSGIDERRFLEIVVQGGNAAKQLDLHQGFTF